MARKRKAKGAEDVLQRGRVALGKSILNLYAAVAEDKEPVSPDSECVGTISRFVYELSQIRDRVAFFSQLEGLATAMRGERAYRDVCGAAVLMLKDKGVTQAEFEKFVRKHCKEK